MRNWQLGTKDPYNLLLTSDFRLCGIHDKVDNTWEIQLEGSERGGLSLYSTLSLRTLSTRIFPIFQNGQQTADKSSEFIHPPVIKKFFSNYVHIAYTPFEGLDLQTHIWMPDNQTVLSKTIVINNAAAAFEGSVNWVMTLNPLQTGLVAKLEEKEHEYFLTGQAQNTFVAFLLSNGAKPGTLSYPSLVLPLQILPGGQSVHQWAFTCNEDHESLVQQSKSLIQADYEALAARMAVFQQRDEIQIQTTSTDWNAAFAFCQKNALQLILPDINADQPAVFLRSRNAEQQYLVYLHDLPPIEKISLLDLWYLLGIIPGAFSSIKVLLERYLRHVASPQETLSSQPYPILAEIVWKIYEKTDDRAWLTQVYPILIKSLQFWFTELQDQDQDGVPEWQHALQSQFEQLPIHNYWHLAGIGTNTQWIESPFLAGLLLHELDRTHQIGECIGATETTAWIESQQKTLTAYLNDSFHPRKKIFKYRDSITHASPNGYKLCETDQSGFYKLNKNLRTAQRLNIKIVNQKESTRKTRIFLHGKTNAGNTVEEISTRQFMWNDRFGVATSKLAFTKINSIEVESLSLGDQVILSVSDYAVEDITSLFPIWNAAISPQRVKHSVDRWLVPALMQPFGLPLVPVNKQPQESDLFNSVDLTLNRFILEGLIRHGQLKLATELYTNLMNAVLKNLKLFKRFYKNYDASDGYGSGDYNIVNGLLPIETYLNLIGIGFWSESKIEFIHYNPFHEPVRIQYRGTTLVCDQNQFEIIFPGGDRFQITGMLPQRFFLTTPSTIIDKEPI